MTYQEKGMEGTAMKNVMSASKCIYVLYLMPNELVRPYGRGTSCYEEIMCFSIPPYCHFEAKYWGLNSLEDLCKCLQRVQ
jgi:hypothetical protein